MHIIKKKKTAQPTVDAYFIKLCCIIIPSKLHTCTMMFTACTFQENSIIFIYLCIHVHYWKLKIFFFNLQCTSFVVGTSIGMT